MTICRGTEAALRRPAEPWDSHAVLQAGKQRPLGGMLPIRIFAGAGLFPLAPVRSFLNRFAYEI